MNSHQLRIMELVAKHKGASSIEQQTPIRKEILASLEALGYDKPTYDDNHNYTYDEEKKAWHYKMIDMIWLNDLKYGGRNSR